MAAGRTTLIELHYLPSARVCSLAALPEDSIHLEAWEHYQKRSFRNRCLIADSHGTKELSIPLRRGKHQRMPIRDARIAWETPWARTHWRTLVSAYGNSPYFAHYRDGLAPLFERRPQFLLDWNLELFGWLARSLGLQGQIALTEAWTSPAPPATVDLRSALSPQERQDRIGFRDVPYGQVFQDRHGFLPGLSALDLLFCTGPGALGILRDMRPEWIPGALEPSAQDRDHSLPIHPPNHSPTKP